MIVNAGNNDNNAANRAVRRQDANPDARVNALDMNWWAAEAVLDNENEALDWDHPDIIALVDQAIQENANLVQPVGRMPGEIWGPPPPVAGQIHEHPVGLEWDHPDVRAQLDREAEENDAAQELNGPQNLDVDYTHRPGLPEDGDPRIEHVPALSVEHGDQICELALDGRRVVFQKKVDIGWTDETLELPEGFMGLKCKFFDAAGTLCVMVFEADGVNTVIYDFHTGQVLGGGPMPEAIDWDGCDCLRKVVLLEGIGLQVVITREEVGIHTITIGI